MASCAVRIGSGASRRFTVLGVVLGLAVAVLALAACASPTPSAGPASALASPAVARPAVQIDTTWTALDHDWTFTGRVDPQADATDVVLEIGPGPATARQFDTTVPVVQGVTDAGPLTVTTREIPDIDLICVRFTATNGGGTSSSQPLCFPHDLPSIPPPGAPTVAIDEHWTVANGDWSFTARVDPQRSATDVVLDIGPGPAPGKFDRHVPVSQGLTEPATLTIATHELPTTDQVCVRFTAKNGIGTASSEPLCFARDATPSQ